MTVLLDEHGLPVALNALQDAIKELEQRIPFAALTSGEAWRVRSELAGYEKRLGLLVGLAVDRIDQLSEAAR